MTAKVLARKRGAIKSCYDKVIKGNKKAKGKVTVSFVVRPDTGRIAKVKVEKAGTTAADSVAECVTKNMEGLVIKPPDTHEGEATFTFDFTINPQKQL